MVRYEFACQIYHPIPYREYPYDLATVNAMVPNPNGASAVDQDISELGVKR